jgi:DNA-directed RNA polymerase specialized sigma subunit
MPLRNKEPSPELLEAAEVTRQMRLLQQKITDLGMRRRTLLRRIWKEQDFTQREIASCLGITGQTVWNEIHKEGTAHAQVTQ